MLGHISVFDSAHLYDFSMASSINSAVTKARRMSSESIVLAGGRKRDVNRDGGSSPAFSSKRDSPAKIFVEGYSTEYDLEGRAHESDRHQRRHYDSASPSSAHLGTALSSNTLNGTGTPSLIFSSPTPTTPASSNCPTPTMFGPTQLLNAGFMRGENGEDEGDNVDADVKYAGHAAQLKGLGYEIEPAHIQAMRMNGAHANPPVSVAGFGAGVNIGGKRADFFSFPSSPPSPMPVMLKGWRPKMDDAGLGLGLERIDEEYHREKKQEKGQRGADDEVMFRSGRGSAIGQWGIQMGIRDDLENDDDENDDDEIMVPKTKLSVIYEDSHEDSMESRRFGFDRHGARTSVSTTTSSSNSSLVASTISQPSLGAPGRPPSLASVASIATTASISTIATTASISTSELALTASNTFSAPSRFFDGHGHDSFLLVPDSGYTGAHATTFGSDAVTSTPRPSRYRKRTSQAAGNSTGTDPAKLVNPPSPSPASRHVHTRQTSNQGPTARKRHGNQGLSGSDHDLGEMASDASLDDEQIYGVPTPDSSLILHAAAASSRPPSAALGLNLNLNLNVYSPVPSMARTDSAAAATTAYAMYAPRTPRTPTSNLAHIAGGGSQRQQDCGFYRYTPGHDAAQRCIWPSAPGRKQGQIRPEAYVTPTRPGSVEIGKGVGVGMVLRKHSVKNRESRERLMVRTKAVEKADGDESKAEEQPAPQGRSGKSLTVSR